MIKDNFRSKIKDYSREPRGPSRNQSLPKYKMHEARIPGVRGTRRPLSPSLFLSLLFISVHEHVQKRLPLTRLKADGIRSCVRDARARASCAYILHNIVTIKRRHKDEKYSLNRALSLKCHGTRGGFPRLFPLMIETRSQQKCRNMARVSKF